MLCHWTNVSLLMQSWCTAAVFERLAQARLFSPALCVSTFQHSRCQLCNFSSFFFSFFFTYCLLKDLSYRKSHMAHQFSLKVLLVSKLYFLNQVRASFMLRTSLSVSLYSNVPTNMLNWLLLSLFQTDVICILLLQLYECPLAVNDDIVFIDHCTFLLLSHAWIVPSRVFACCCTDN